MKNICTARDHRLSFMFPGLDRDIFFDTPQVTAKTRPEMSPQSLSSACLSVLHLACDMFVTFCSTEHQV